MSAPGPPARPAPCPLPSPAALALARASRDELERALVRGATPALDALLGWELRGILHPSWARWLGIQKFVKGFFRTDDGRALGYNSPVAQNAVDGRWRLLPEDGAPRRFGRYAVAPVDPTARDRAYLHALLLDYGRGGNAPWDPARGLRDYLVQVDPSNPDLFLGKAYYAIGAARVPLSFFILERHRRGLTDFAHRAA